MLSEARTHLQSDPVLAQLIRNYELPEIIPSTNLFANLIESIISQQLSVKASDTIFKRLLSLLPEVWTAHDLAKLTVTELRAIGVSNSKATYLHAAAQHFHTHATELINIHNIPDEEIISHLTQIKGVGRWTAEMMLIFTFARPDVFHLVI